MLRERAGFMGSAIPTGVTPSFAKGRVGKDLQIQIPLYPLFKSGMWERGLSS